MPQVKGMRWQTAIEVVQAGVRAHIERKSHEVQRGSELLTLLQQLEPPPPSGAPKAVVTPIKSAKGFGRSGKPQPGTIPDRVLEVVGEFDAPVAMDQIIAAKLGAPQSNVILAVRELVRAGQLVATSGPRNRRYGLPNLKTARPA